MLITPIKYDKHADDTAYKIDFRPKFSPVFFILYEPMQETGIAYSKDKISYSRKKKWKKEF